MARRYTYATTLNWGGDTPTAEVEVEVSFTVAWGSPETGNYGPPEDYDPGSPDVVEDIRLDRVEGKARPWGMYSGFIANEDDEFATDCIEKLEGSAYHLAEMIGEARIVETGRRETAEELRDAARREAV